MAEIQHMYKRLKNSAFFTPISIVLNVLKTVFVQPLNVRKLNYFCLYEDPPVINDNFKYLLSITMSSPWRFTAVLADIFAAQIVPPGTYNTLKLSLLLNLVQTCNNGKQSMEHLDLLIGTSDPVTVDRYSLVLCDIYDLYIKGGIYKISLRSLLNILDLSNYIIFL